MSASNPHGLKGGVKDDAARRERLASELRANLKKRKTQARLRAAGDRPEDGAAARPDTDMQASEKT